MIIIKRIKVINIDESQLDYDNITQLYTMGNYMHIVYEDGKGSYTTARLPIKTLSKMEVEF